MKTQNIHIDKNKRPIVIVVAVIFILLIPLITMQFTSEVDWTLADFIVAGSLLLVAGALLEIAIRMVSNINYRVVTILAILIALLLVWAELAVGLFGTPFAGS